MNKLQMAHEYALKMLSKDTKYLDIQNIADNADRLAGLLLAKYSPKCSQELDVELLPEFSNQCTNQENMDSGERLMVDWKWAPIWAESWAMDRSGLTYWYLDDQPKQVGTCWRGDVHERAPTFGFENSQINWKDSLRKRSK